MSQHEAANVSGAVGQIAYELISAAHRGQKWESHVHVSRGPDGTPDGGLDIRITIKPPAKPAAAKDNSVNHVASVV